MSRSLLHRFYQMASINILAILTEPLAGLIATAFLGHLPEINDFAGVNLASILFNYIFETMFCLRISTTALTAQAVGRNERENLLLVGIRSAFVALVAGVMIVLLQYPLGVSGFNLLNISPELAKSGLSYFYTRIWGTPAVLLNFVIIGWFLGREENIKVFVLTGIGNITYVVLSYLTIIQWGWGSQGAGLSQAFSEYLILLIGLILMIGSIEWQIMPGVIQKFWDISAFRATISFNRDLLLKSCIQISVWAIFFFLSTNLRTEILSVNTLLQQVIFFVMCVIEGVGIATETLTGNLQSQPDKAQLRRILQISLLFSTLIGFFSSVACIFFPEVIFGLLTNHHEIIDLIKIYVPWLFLVLVFFSISWILEGYFTGLGNGKASLNASVIAILVGFAPTAFWAWINHDNHILWLAISAFMLTRMIVLLAQLLGTTSDSTIDINQI